MRYASHKSLYALALMLPLPALAETPSIVSYLGDTKNGQNVVYFTPNTPPKAVLIMLPGGTGKIGISDDGAINHNKNFLIRTKDDWLNRGYAVLIPDASGNHNLRGKRSNDRYLTTISNFITYAQSQTKAPLFLMGTSQGTVAAVNGAAHLPPDQIAGLILTESVSRGGKRSSKTVFDAAPDQVTAPVLIVANRDDQCPVAVPDDAPKIAQAFASAKTVDLQMVSGGTVGKASCSSMSPHGYHGIEDQVINIIGNWIDKNIQTP